MQYLYIDESGSMTTRHTKSWPYFVIAIVRTEDPDRLRKLYKRFVVKHMNTLRAADNECRMFKGEVFQELKGAAFTPDLKRAFIAYFCRENTMELYYVVINNRRITGELYTNTARAERTDTRHFLQTYLNTELRMENILSKDIQVKYFDSSQNKIIQIADVLANFYFSQLRTKNYGTELRQLENARCLKSIFKFSLY